MESAMRGYDLDLLRYLQVLLEEESVSSAAKRLNISEPAMSRNLAKLRAVFGDPILIQSGRRMTASSFAISLRDRVQMVVRDADRLIEARAVTDLSKLSLRFTIRANDLIVATLGRPLLKALREECPNCTLITVAPELDPEKRAVMEPFMDQKADEQCATPECEMGDEGRAEPVEAVTVIENGYDTYDRRYAQQKAPPVEIAKARHVHGITRQAIGDHSERVT